MNLRKAPSNFVGSLFLLMLLLTGSPKEITASIVSSTSRSIAKWVTARKNIVLPVATYASYCSLVHLYAKKVLKDMLEVPDPDHLAPEDIAASHGILPSELRTTVSKRNNLVIRPGDRLRWNQWIAHRNGTTKLKAGDIHSLCGSSDDKTTPEFWFKYRTHANKEEIAAFSKPFWTFQRFLFTFEGPSRMVFSEPTKTLQNPYGRLPKVMAEDFISIGGGLTRLVIRKWGNLVRNKDRNREYDYQIKWETVYLHSRFRTKYIHSGEPSFSMWRTPWDIVNIEDEMISLRIAGKGYVVYDSKA